MEMIRQETASLVLILTTIRQITPSTDTGCSRLNCSFCQRHNIYGEILLPFIYLEPRCCITGCPSNQLAVWLHNRITISQVMLLLHNMHMQELAHQFW